jgi:hypothetical protein
MQKQNHEKVGAIENCSIVLITMIARKIVLFFLIKVSAARLSYFLTERKLDTEANVSVSNFSCTK